MGGSSLIHQCQNCPGEQNLLRAREVAGETGQTPGTLHPAVVGIHRLDWRPGLLQACWGLAHSTACSDGVVIGFEAPFLSSRVTRALILLPASRLGQAEGRGTGCGQGIRMETE